uniref:Fibronectin type-III domain-containing protein n=1 Tax=Salvator merianae TaxID=96440 RepID=A0A8D0DUD7_SALMN
MVGRCNLTWLLFLSLKVFGLNKGDPDVPMGLECYQSLPSNVMNCSWFTREVPDVNTVQFLYYESLKFHPDQTRRVESPSGCNWVIIERSHLTQGDTYSVWVEAHSASGTATSNKISFNLDEIVKLPPPIMDTVELNCSGAVVSWKLPDLYDHQHLTCALQYKASKDHSWIYLSEDHIGPQTYDLEDLKPFTSYEVQARCIPENGKGVWSEWSTPQTFITQEAAPLGQVDMWYKTVISENNTPSLLLLWKVLDPEATRGIILDYEVKFRDHHGKNITHMVRSCCSVFLPHSAVFASVSARNSVGKTFPASLNFSQTDLPGPEEVQVLAVQALGFNVTWKPSSSPLWVQPLEYVVEWQEEFLSSKADSLNWTRRPGSSDYALLRDDFKPNIPYIVCVYAQYSQGNSPSESVRAYFQEAVPSAGPQALQDQSISPTASCISWEEIPLADCNGHIIYYTLYLKHLELKTPKAFRTNGATERRYILSDLKPGTSYQVWITGSTSAGEGVPSSLHYFQTPGSHWKIIVLVTLLVGLLLITASVVTFVKHTWILGICHKILPLWCYEKIPDPRHSGAILKIDEQNAAASMDALSKLSAKCVEELVIVEIKEPPPQQITPPVLVKNSGYEKRFLPTQEELQRLG